MSEILGRKYGFFTTTCLVVGIIVGVGVYFRTGEILEICHYNPRLALLAWVAGGIFAVVTSLTMAEIAASYAETGGDITYMRATNGDVPTFMLGWGLVTVGLPSLIVILSWVAAGFSASALALDPTDVQAPLALIYIAIAFGLNLFAPKTGARGHGIITIAKLVPLACLIIGGLFLSGSAPLGNLTDALLQPLELPPGRNVLLVFLSALVPVVFAFGGAITAAVVSGEIENPRKNLPKAIVVGMIIVTAVYILLYLAFINTLPAERLADEGVIPFGVAEALFGSVGARLITIAIVISALGTLNGLVIAGIRLPYSLAIKGLIVFPRYLSVVDRRFDMPLRSGVVMLVVSLLHWSLYAVVGERGGDYSNIGVVIGLVFYVLIYVGLIRLRLRGKLRHDGFRTPLFPLFPILSAAMTIMIGIGLFFIDATTTRQTLIAIAFYAAGLPLYWLTRRRP